MEHVHRGPERVEMLCRGGENPDEAESLRLIEAAKAEKKRVCEILERELPDCSFIILVEKNLPGQQKQFITTYNCGVTPSIPFYLTFKHLNDYIKKCFMGVGQ